MVDTKPPLPEPR